MERDVFSSMVVFMAFSGGLLPRYDIGVSPEIGASTTVTLSALKQS